MKRLLVLFFVFCFSHALFALTVNDVAGDYIVRYQSFTSNPSPTQGEAHFKLNPDSTWAIMCKQTYGGTTYSYPCDGKVYTWYLDSSDSLYPIKLNYGNYQVYASFAGTGDLLAYVPNVHLSLLMSRVYGSIVTCDFNIEPLFEKIPASGGTFQYVISSTIETCNVGYISIAEKWGSVSQNKSLKTNDFLITIDVEENTDVADRPVTLQSSYAGYLTILQEGAD
jgi:hypothetical protein